MGGAGVNPPLGGSVSQPHQEFASIDAEGNRPIVGAEVIPAGVILCCLASGAPADGAILRVGAVPEDLRESGEVHRIGVPLTLKQYRF